MGYNKIIIYGNNIDVYEYEKDIVRLAGRQHIRSSDIGSENLGISGENSLSERDNKRTLGRRPDNAWRASLAFRRVVASNLGGHERPLLVTLTYGENLTDLKTGYKHFSSFIQSLRHKYGKVFKYIAVPEFQVRGAVHFHSLFWGLPSEIFLLERKNRTIAKIWGHGYVFMKETDGNEKLSHYLAKYMAKAFVDERLKNQKSYVASRNIQRPIFFKGVAPVWPILDDYNAENTPVVDRTYKVQRLDGCRYRLFKIKE